MKLTHARIATNDVPALVQFYQKITEICPVGSEDYVEFQSSARATTPAANRSAIIEFQVDDVDRERARLEGSQFVLEPTTQPGGTGPCCFATQMAT
jgi:predicted enzyme related to lactoylglutathione lyase